MNDTPTPTVFRKKPVEIEATQWHRNGDHPHDRVGKQELDPVRLADKYPELFHDDGEVGPITATIDADPDVHYLRLEGAVVRFYRHPDVDGSLAHCDVPGTARPQCVFTMDEHGWIDTMEGGHTVCPGDWIITGVRGEVYPCEQHIFDETYEPVR